MNLTTELDAFSTTAFPDRTITDSSLKTPAWIKQMAAAGVTEFMRSMADWRLWAHDPNVGENIRYAEGRQDTRQYMRLNHLRNGYDSTALEVTNRDGYFEENASGEQQYSSRHRGTGSAKDPMGLTSIINARPLPILPVKLRGLKSTVMEQGYEATITALGKKAMDERRDHEAEARLWMDWGKQFADYNLSPPPSMPDPMPETEAEMRTYLDSWQVGAAADLERKVKICWNESRGNQLMNEVADDILRHGYGCLADAQLPGRRPQSKRILPHRGLFGPSAYPDCRDLEMGGYLETMHLSTVLNESKNNRRTVNSEGKNWTNADRDLLRQLAQSTLPENMQRTDPLIGNTVGTGTVTVVRYFFLTDDLWSEETYTNEAGYVKKKKAGYEQELPTNEDGVINRQIINCLYEATLICGTNLAYNCRKAYDQGRDLHDPQKAKMPVSIFIAGLVEGEPVSVVQNAKGIVDEIERSMRAYMAIKRTYTPSGSNIPPDLLGIMADALKIGGDNKEMAAYQFIKQTGDSFFPRTDPNNPNMVIQGAISSNPFGIPDEAAKHLADVFQQLQVLEMITGANAVVSAATPTGDAQGKGVNQIALQGAANIMSFLRDGLKLIYENNSRNIAGRIWLTEQETPVTGIVTEVNGTRKQVQPSKDMHEYEFFMEVTLGPTNQEKADFKQNAFLATQGGPNAQLNFDDYQQVCWLINGNLKTAQRYMAVAVARKARNDEKKAMNIQKANADGNASAGQAVEKSRQETLQMQSQLDMALAEFQRDTAWGGIDRQVAGQAHNAQINAMAKVQVAGITEVGNTARTDATHLHRNTNDMLNAALQQQADLQQQAALQAQSAAKAQPAPQSAPQPDPQQAPQPDPQQMQPEPQPDPQQMQQADPQQAQLQQLMQQQQGQPVDPQQMQP